MLDISIVNETSPEATWNRQTGRQAGRRTDGQTCVLGGCASKNEDGLKNVNDLKNKVNLKNKEELKKEDDLLNEDGIES